MLTLAQLTPISLYTFISHVIMRNHLFTLEFVSNYDKRSGSLCVAPFVFSCYDNKRGMFDALAHF